MIGATIGNPGVSPSPSALAGNRKERVRQARPEVARRIDGVAGRTSERQADAEHENADEERLQPAAEHGGQIDVARPRKACALAAIARMPNSSTAVPINSVMRFAPVFRTAGAVQNTASFAAGSSVSAQCGRYASQTSTAPSERANHLRGDVSRHVRPGEAADGGERDRHRRIEMRAADAADGVDAPSPPRRPIRR